MNKYSLKSSEAEWIEQIPIHWNVIRLKETADSGLNTFIDGDWIESSDISDEGIRYITSGNVGDGKYKEQGHGYITEETFRQLKCKEVFPGDILISRLNPPISRACLVPDLGNRIITCVDNVIFRPQVKNYDKRFLVYMLNCSSYSNYMTNIGRGATMQRISRTQLEKTKVIIPTLDEQKRIANYLDAKTESIDKKVDILEQKKQKYVQLRRSIIKHAVTRGLNANAPLKDSGVEWIGKMSSNWGVCRLKDFTNIIAGQAPVGEDIMEDGNTPFMQGKAEFGEIYPNSRFYCESCTKKSRFGDILMSVRAPIGDVNISDKVYGIGRGLCSIKPINIDKMYLWYILNTCKSHIESLGTGSTFLAITATDISNILAPIPPLQEQQEIAAYLDDKCKKIDDILANIDEQIEKYKLLKRALINEVVTGQRAV